MFDAGLNTDGPLNLHVSNRVAQDGHEETVYQRDPLNLHVSRSGARVWQGKMAHQGVLRPMTVSYGETYDVVDMLDNLRSGEQPMSVDAAGDRGAVTEGVILSKARTILKIDNSSYEQEKHYYKVLKINSGSFGYVDLCMDLKTHQLFARKTFITNPSYTEIEVLLALNESSQDSPKKYFPTFFGLLRKGCEIFFLMEYIDRNWRQALEGQPRDATLLPLLVDMWADALSGLLDMHSHDYMHLDVKPENLGYNFEIGKILDFGSCATSQQPCTAGGNTAFYMSPELCGARQEKATDVWALACSVLSVLLPGNASTVWHQESKDFQRQIMRDGTIDQKHLLFLHHKHIVNHIYHNPTHILHYIPRWLPPDITNVLEHMLVADPDQRWSVHDALLGVRAVEKRFQTAYNIDRRNMLHDHVYREQQNHIHQAMVRHQLEAIPLWEGKEQPVTRITVYMSLTDTLLGYLVTVGDTGLTCWHLQDFKEHQTLIMRENNPECYNEAKRLILDSKYQVLPVREALCLPVPGYNKEDQGKYFHVMSDGNILYIHNEPLFGFISNKTTLQTLNIPTDTVQRLAWIRQQTAAMAARRGLPVVVEELDPVLPPSPGQMQLPDFGALKMDDNMES